MGLKDFIKRFSKNNNPNSYVDLANQNQDSVVSMTIGVNDVPIGVVDLNTVIASSTGNIVPDKEMNFGDFKLSTKGNLIIQGDIHMRASSVGASTQQAPSEDLRLQPMIAQENKIRTNSVSLVLYNGLLLVPIVSEGVYNILKILNEKKGKDFLLKLDIDTDFSHADNMLLSDTEQSAVNIVGQTIKFMRPKNIINQVYDAFVKSMGTAK